MKKILILSLLTLMWPGVSFATVSNFVFVTDPQTVLPGGISESITVQSQNTSALEEDILETFDFIFTSSSATGEFLNSSGNAVSKTMSKNTSNRTFYYRDSSIGEHTISIKATGRESQSVFTASQKIKISLTVTDSVSEKNETIPVDESSPSSSKSIQSSTSNENVDFDVSIGKDKFSSVGNSVVFQAVPKNLKNITAQYIQYQWVMGDGARVDGPIISHTYRYPGEYNVIVNAYYMDKSTTARIKITVIEPILNLKLVSGGVEIDNKSIGEINLGDWRFESGAQKFVIPNDTIIGKNKKIVFSRDVMRISGESLYLKDPLGTQIAYVTPTSTSLFSDNIIVTKIPEESTSEKVLNMKTNNLASKEENSKVIEDVSFTKIENPIVLEIPIVATTTEEIKEIETKKISNFESENQVATVYVAKTKTRRIDNLLTIPIRSFNWFLDLFR